MNFRFVRLNATLYPASELEQSLYAKLGIEPEYVEEEDPQALIRRLAGCDAVAVVSTGLPAAVVASLDRCRLISRLGNGTDKIAVAKATEQGIVVANAPFFCAEEMTDHIMAMLLSLARQLPRMEHFMRAGRFRQARAEATQLQRLSTCVLGIVGFGATGEMVARRARAFGLRVLATRRNLQAPRPADLDIEMVPLDALLAESDFVSLQLPLNADTYHLFDETLLRQMKPGAYLINTSRGALVDEDALVRVLREGPLAGAALDLRVAQRFHGPSPALAASPHGARQCPDDLPRLRPLRAVRRRRGSHGRRQSRLHPHRPLASAGEHRQSQCGAAVSAETARPSAVRKRVRKRKRATMSADGIMDVLVNWLLCELYELCIMYE